MSDEVWLAEKMLDMHGWADQVRLLGGEANAIAIRIARAATGKEAVAICGYHGWHDWYLATNIKNKTGRKTLITRFRTARGTEISFGHCYSV